VSVKALRSGRREYKQKAPESKHFLRTGGRYKGYAAKVSGLIGVYFPYVIVISENLEAFAPFMAIAFRFVE
jgi:hypothetical protein